MNDTDQPVVRVRDLIVATSDGQQLVNAADVTVRRGRITALTGPSGAGKTTVLRALTGALPPGTTHTGEVDVLGHRILELPEGELRRLRRHRIGYVGQDPGSSLNPRMRVRRLVAETAADPGPEAVRALLAEVRLPAGAGIEDRRPPGLSGGQQRRVALARALARRPGLLLLDEPTAGLDPALRDQIARLLRHLADRRALAVVLTCHDAELIDRLADDVVRLAGTGVVPLPSRSPATARTAPSGPPVLDVRALTASLGARRARVPVLHGIDFAVPAGCSAGIVGASGSGKTTLVRAVAGLHRPAGGSVALDGAALPPRAADRSREQRRRIQLVPQDPLGALNPSRTVGATLSRPLALHRRAGAGRVAELLQQVGLGAEFAYRYPYQLSGGQRQRVSIARALAAEPDVLLCDEVTSALDPDTARTVMDLLTALRDRHRLALVLISHDIALVGERTDTVTVIGAGRVLRSGRTAEVLADAAGPPI